MLRQIISAMKTCTSLKLNVAFRFEGDSGSDIEMTSQLRGNVSPLTPPLKMATMTLGENTSEIELPPPPPPPGDQVMIS